MHIEIIHPETRWAHTQRLMQMHHHRKQVFVDQLGWELPVRGSWLEVDEFDSDFAIYLMVCAPDGGGHLASVRLLPTTRPHMFETTFRSLCPNGPIVGDDCWEISRLVCNPAAVTGAEAVRVMRKMALELVEFAVLNGIQRYTLLAEAARVPALLSMGWRISPISAAAEWRGALVQALMIEVDKDTLPRIRRRLGLDRTIHALVPSMKGGLA